MPPQALALCVLFSFPITCGEHALGRPGAQDPSTRISALRPLDEEIITTLEASSKSAERLDAGLKRIVTDVSDLRDDLEEEKRAYKQEASSLRQYLEELKDDLREAKHKLDLAASREDEKHQEQEARHKSEMIWIQSRVRALEKQTRALEERLHPPVKERPATEPTSGIFDEAAQAELESILRSQLKRGARWEGHLRRAEESILVDAWVERCAPDESTVRWRIQARQDPMLAIQLLGEVPKSTFELWNTTFRGDRIRLTGKPRVDSVLFGLDAVEGLRLRWKPNGILVGFHLNEHIELRYLRSEAAEQNLFLHSLRQIDTGWKKSSPASELERNLESLRKLEKEARNLAWSDLASQARLEQGQICFELLLDQVNRANSLGGVQTWQKRLLEKLEPLLLGLDTEPIEGGNSVRARALYYLCVGVGASSLYHDLYGKREHKALYQRSRDYLLQLEQQHSDAIDEQQNRLTELSEREFRRLRDLMRKH